MADRMTSIHLPGLPGAAGYADRGRCEPAAMISLIRRVAQRNLEHSQAILAASNDDFRIETYVGVWVQNRREVLQPGRALDICTPAQEPADA